MKRYISLAVLLTMALGILAQKVTFYSPEFEAGVRAHIGLEKTGDVLQTHTDTITSLDLSGLGITDIRDAVYLTAVKRLDLSYNEITDISPLLALESLGELDLSNNQLESINILAFINTGHLEVDVANNHISDFSYLFSSTKSELTITGLNDQMAKEQPYFELYQFYAGVDGDRKPVIMYRGYTNIASPLYLQAGFEQQTAQLDGESYQVGIPGSPTAVTQVTLTNGENSVTTYVVPSKELTVGGGKSIVMETGLPNDYELLSASAENGTVEIAGNSLKYTAPAVAVSDVVNFSYYQGHTLKGFSRFFINSGLTTKPGDANGDGVVTVTDAVTIISHISGETPAGFNTKAADMNGDGLVTVADAVQVIDLILRKE